MMLSAVSAEQRAELKSDCADVQFRAIRVDYPEGFFQRCHVGHCKFDDTFQIAGGNGVFVHWD
jgi:hypothetical protein